jgi:hypothetical protein
MMVESLGSDRFIPGEAANRKPQRGEIYVDQGERLWERRPGYIAQMTFPHFATRRVVASLSTVGRAKEDERRPEPRDSAKLICGFFATLSTLVSAASTPLQRFNARSVQIPLRISLMP